MYNDYINRMAVIEYFATGEGFHVYILINKTTSEEKTRKALEEYFIKQHSSSFSEYMKQGIVVYNEINEKILSKYLSKSVIEAIKNERYFDKMIVELNFASPL